MKARQFQEVIGIRFNDVALLRQALTHRSFINEQADDHMRDNERMEFLGDAILDFIVADMLYQNYPDMSEGELTRLRSGLVRTESLAELARSCNIGEYLYMGKGEENSGGRERTNNLCRAFEAVIGAIYLDQGLEAVRSFVLPRLQHLQQRALEEAMYKDARSQLQEWSQAQLSITPIYRTQSASGPDHNKEFVIEVLIGERVVATGTGRSKQTAAQAAAQAALTLIREGRFTLEA
ncbi:MAG: ribonuclease III [Anaerolineae bacterium]|jgi:ribonuclease-3|nr:ribonuclease III [Anaerolineae bacterium]